MAAEIARVDALIASGMWLYADQAAFPLLLTTTVVWFTAMLTERSSTPTAACGIRLPKRSTCKPQSTQLPTKQLLALLLTTRSERCAWTCWKRTLRLPLQLQLAMPPLFLPPTATPTPRLRWERPWRTRHLVQADAINDDANVYTTLDRRSLQYRVMLMVTKRILTPLRQRLADASTLEADPTTATAVAAVQADVDQNESDSDAADAALSARLDVLEADPTTATAVAAVQSDVDQNEADADAAAGEATTRGNAIPRSVDGLTCWRLIRRPQPQLPPSSLM